MEQLRNIFTKPWIYIFIICIGISLKFYRLDYKIMWYDEIATVLQITGSDSALEIDNSKLNEIAPISHYTGLLKNPKLSLGAEYKAQLQNMNLNPLHYMLLSIWYRIVGDSFVDYRLFSVFIFLLTLPFLFGLTNELFRSKRAGLIAVSLFSVSPFIHYFAQEARYYMLWAFLLVVIHYFLIKAINHKKTKWWIGYSVFAILSLYASTLSGFIIFEHLLFIWFFKKEFRIKFLVILGIIALIYFPWLYYVLLHKEEVNSSLSWHKTDVVPLWAPLLGLVLGLVRTFSFYENYTLFWDDVFHNITTSMIIETGFNLVILFLIIFSIIQLIKKEKRETAWFILLILLPGLVFFWSLDIIRNALITHWWRYYIFNTIPIVLLITYVISKYIDSKKVLIISVYVGIISISIFSIYTISKYKYWYIGGNWEQEFVDNAELLSQAKKPLMITDFTWMNTPWEGPMHCMEILANCTSKNIDVLRVESNKKEIERIIPKHKYSDIYVINVSDICIENLKNEFGQRLQILPGKEGPPRWIIRLEKE